MTAVAALVEHVDEVVCYLGPDRLKRVIIHKGVAEIAEETFAAFGPELNICYEVSEKPEGWAENIEREGGPKVVWGCED